MKLEKLDQAAQVALSAKIVRRIIVAEPGVTRRYLRNRLGKSPRSSLDLLRSHGLVERRRVGACGEGWFVRSMGTIDA